MAEEKKPGSLLGLLVLLVLVGATAVLREQVVPAALEPQTVERELEQELGSRVGAVLEWKQTRLRETERLADEPALRARLADALAGASAPLDALLGSLCVDFAGCVVAQADGRVLGSYGGRTLPPGLLQRAARGRTVHSSLLATDAFGALDPAPAAARHTVFFATPIVEEGRTRAILVARVQPDRELDPILNGHPPGRSGETYAVDPRGFMVTRSRFESGGRSAPLAPNVLGEPATWVRTPARELTRALASLHDSGSDVDGYVDYRGVRVVGAWRWLDDLGAGVVTEMDADEAYRRRR